MASVTSEEVAEYWPLFESLAKRFSRVNHLAEFDDLVQEGAIAVWLKMQIGPMSMVHATVIAKSAMRDWIRYVTHGGRVEASVPS